MTVRCTNCNQLVLPDDESCWQCGYALPKREAPPKTTQDGWLEVGKAQTAGSTAEFTLSAVWVYGLLTAALAVAAVLLLNQLKQYPLVQLTYSDPIPVRWRAVTAPDHLFTLNLPREWRWVGEQNAPLEAQLATNPQVIEGTRPLGPLVSDLEIIFLATHPDFGNPEARAPFTIVARSVELNDLTAEEQLAAAQSTGYLILQAEIVEDAARSHLLLRPDLEEEELRCKQQVVNGRSAALLLSTCIHPSAYFSNASTIDEIHRSFEFLLRDE